jgi:hypothetical protein
MIIGTHAEINRFEASAAEEGDGTAQQTFADIPAAM